MKIFLSIAAALAWIFGGALIVAPAQFYAPTGISMTPTPLGAAVPAWLDMVARKESPEKGAPGQAHPSGTT